MTGDSSSASYTLSDMAADAAGLLDALGISAAHIVGASMGGMIAQAFAIEHPDKTLSLCSIMSTTGDVEVGQPAAEALEVLVGAPPQNVEEAADTAVLASKVIGGKGYPLDEARVRERAVEAWNRDHDQLGFARQLVGIIASGDRTPGLRGVTAPTLVIHGADDPLVTPSGGEATAKAVPGAELLTLDGMGHDMPIPLWPRIIDAIVDNAGRADTPAPA
jgi:pimeloyl-ACP methyl ester carboxylesterase